MWDNIRVVIALLHRDIKIMLRFLFDNIVDSMILVSFVYLMYVKLLPLMGISTGMATPAFVGILVIAMINVAYDRAIKDSLDFETTRLIDYQITLPLSIRWLVVKYLISYSIDLFLASFPVLVMGRILFGALLDVAHGNLMLFFLIYCLSIVLIGAILLCTIIAKPFQWIIENMWPRVLLPMISFGALYYPWKPAAKALPLLSKGMLILPTVYVAEGLRSALTGSALYISSNVCIMAICVSIFFVVSLMFWFIQQRIDPV